MHDNMSVALFLSGLHPTYKAAPGVTFPLRKPITTHVKEKPSIYGYP